MIFARSTETEQFLEALRLKKKGKKKRKKREKEKKH